MSEKLTRHEFVLKSIVLGCVSFMPRFLTAQTPEPARGKFDADSTAEEVTAGLDLSGKTILVTGANSGLGFETMRVLALRGAHVLATARNTKKAEAAAAKITGRVTPLVCELTDFESIVNCSLSVEKLGKPLDALICNAGIIGTPELQTVHGIEKQFLVNYLGHFLLAQRLLPRLKAAPQGRLVLLSSGLHTRAPEAGIEFDNLAGENSYDQLGAYGQSKLAMALFAAEFSRRFSGGNMTANSLHPGVIKTNLFEHLPLYMRVGINLFGWAFMKSVAEGAATQCYVATHPALANVSGHFFADSNPIDPGGPHIADRELAGRLWDVSMKLTAKYLK